MQPSDLLGIDARIWQALIAGGVVALGWIVAGWRSRAEASRLRAERLRDAHRALFAEIRNACADYWAEGEADAQAAALTARMESDPEFVPFVPHEIHDRVFVAMLGEIDVLPRQTIDAVIAFYAIVASIAALTEDMRGRGFRMLEPQRRLSVYRDYMAMRRRAFVMGQNAMKLISAFAEGGAPAAERMSRRLGAR